MSTSELIRQIHLKSPFNADPSSTDEDDAANADSLIGLFQNFRPDGKGLQGIFSDLEPHLDREVGIQLEERLDQLFTAAGDDRRPQGGRDAYFVVRQPPEVSVAQASAWATQWMEQLAELANNVGDAETASVLDPIPSVRVLEGIPPKHPKLDEEKTLFLTTMQQDVSILLERMDAGPAPAALRQAYYFISCDAMLRDYLMWPIYRSVSAVEDPFLPYFELWRHGVKYRIFQEKQMDLYLPRR
ncbi:apolipoprotein acyltransferase [Rubripirellula amarantea]|uniref:Apolipoprotein acyltransferase n=1 Tax=Rubripirellula amarantea TaxID=2527999 RepID=A0A5C5WQI0_9BACT|nr:apolipoprotein acyltransferase [Rubripirellula amarantea]MDA8745497.1 apolipoprotein acyltransferase [Rubripirellula amarantea]TWT52535.1 hypothetical protein Pla22_01590 [Rubripirellula amarantea]